MGVRKLIEGAGDIALRKYCYKQRNKPTMLPPIPNSSKFIDKFPDKELNKENLSDQRKQESYEAEVKVYRAFESLKIDLVVLHGLDYTNQQYSEYCPEFEFDRTNPGRIAGECDLVVIGPGVVLIIEVSDVRCDETRTTNKRVRKAFNQKKSQCERTERLVRAMLRGYDERETDDPIIKWFFACPSLSRETIKYDEDEMSKIIFFEDVETGPEGHLSERFAMWWETNINEPVEYSIEKMEHISKLLIGLWIIDPKNTCSTKQKCSIGGNILETDKLLRDAKITYSFGRKSTAYQNPNIVEADEVFQKMGICYLSKKQNEVLASEERFLWINGPAGSGKTVLILGKAIGAVQNGSTKVVLFVNVNEENSKEIYQNILRNAGVRFKVLEMSMKFESDKAVEVNNLARTQAKTVRSYFEQSVQIVVFRVSHRASSLFFHIWRDIGGLQLIKDIVRETVSGHENNVRIFIDDGQCLLKDESFDRLKEVGELRKITENIVNCKIWICSDIAQSMYHMDPTDSLNLTKHKQAMEELYHKDQHPIINLEENFRNTFDISITLSALRRKILWSPDQTMGHFIHGPKPTIQLFPTSSVHGKLTEILMLEVNKLVHDGIMKASDIGFIINDVDSCMEMIRKSEIMEMTEAPAIVTVFDTFSVEWLAVICLMDVTYIDYEANLAPELYLAISRGRVYSSVFMFSDGVDTSSEYLVDVLDTHADVQVWLFPGEGNYSDGEGNYSDGEGNYSDGEGNYSDGEGNYPDGEGNYPDGEGNHSDGEENHSDGEGNFTEGLFSNLDHMGKVSVAVDKLNVDEVDSAGPSGKEDTGVSGESTRGVLGEGETHVFLSHDWGTDELGRNNHDRVSAVNDALKQLGYRTWFDSDRMTGDIVDTLCEGIDNTRLVLVFVTQKYVKEVKSGQDNNTKKLQFNYAVRGKGVKNIIPVIMEDRMKNPGESNYS